MIIEGYLKSRQEYELIIVGGINQFGKQWKAKYSNEKIKFTGAIFDKKILNNLRYFSKLHFHGHSVGGTNPSLLEAMACGCTIAAHANIFNKAILEKEASYCYSSEEIASLIDSKSYEKNSAFNREKNLNKIREIYSWEKIVSAYEKLMIEAMNTKASPVPSALHQIV